MRKLLGPAHYLRTFVTVKQERTLLLLVIALIVFIALGTAFFYEFNIYATGQGSNIIILIGAISCTTLVLALAVFALLANRNIEKAYGAAFLIAAIITGLFFIVVFFPGTGPDEDRHYDKPYAYSNVILGTSGSADSTPMRRTDAELYESFDRRLSLQAYDTLKSRFHIFNEYESDDIVEVPGKVDVTAIRLLPQLRIPATMGITLGRLMNLSGLFTFYLARFLNLLSFVILAYFAIKITPYAKALFMAISLLPMTLFICSTLSYDAGIIGMALLFIAICFKCKDMNGIIPRKYLVGLFVLAILLFPCKVVYFFLVFLVFLIPNEKFASTRTARAIKISLVLVSILSILAFSLSGILSVGFGDKSDVIGRGEEANRFHSSSEIVEQPAQFIYILANTAFQHTDFYLQSFLGGALGTLQDEIKAPWGFILIYALILLLAAQRNSEDKTTINGRTKLLFAMICFATSLGVLVSMFLAFTLADEMVIYGVQGKYFLPIAPLMLLILRMNKTLLAGDPRKYILFASFGLNQAYILYLFEAMLRVPV